MVKNPELLIVGGGSAGMAAALAARKNGIQDILILETDPYLGGVLRQCIHTGFGLQTFGEDLTGPEYAGRYQDMMEEEQIPYLLNTPVLEILPDLTVLAISRTEGYLELHPKAIVAATGCRERSAGTIAIPGTRPAGVLTAGTAQRYINIEGYHAGREVVILGSGDIGLIMARRLTLEGAHVKCVAELMPKSGGLKRNIVQCLEDFDIPLLLSTTVAEIHGKERVTGVTLAPVDENLRPIREKSWYVECDTLLLSVGLVPETELFSAAGAEIERTNGLKVDDKLMTSIPGLFGCGNVVKVHDLVDRVSRQGELAGKYAAEYILGGK